ncbi:MAG TPA: cytochrome B [Cyclobacteriaceae bacterium]
MYGTFLLLHSLVRYVVLILLIVLILKSLMGWTSKATFGSTDNKISLFTLIFTHTQFLLGLILYFVSPFVVFGGERDRMASYWTFEHISMMLIAVVLITVGRSTMKKLTEGPAKHKRLFIFNLIALIVIIAAIAMAKRGFFGLPI